ncbi:MAG: DUF3426 domain-containing protein [Deltaproteobacteria bacterium]|nr:DUF3426 domain-containing protein [Deltaproteobacteria bacterium]
MIVECPACHTRYRINDSATLNESTIFECSLDRCRQVFPCAPELFKGGPREEPEDSFPIDLQTEDDLDESDPPEEILPLLHQQAPPISFQTKATPASSSLPVQPIARILPDSFNDEEGLSLTEEEEDPPFSLATTRVYTKPGPLAREPIPSRKQAQPVADHTLSLNILFAFLGILLLGYVLLSVYGRMNLKSTEAILARLPLIGPRFIASQFSAHHIALSDLKTILAVTKDSKRILAIAGKATNTAPVPASTIQIEGTLYDTAGKVLVQQQTFCGTETAVETLPNLTTREISILQRLAPPKQFSVASGQSISFLIVFVNLPVTVAELGGRVLTVQFRTSN